MSNYTIIKQEVNVDNETIEVNELGEIQIKKGAVTQNLLGEDILLKRNFNIDINGNLKHQIHSLSQTRSGGANTWFDLPNLDFTFEKDLGEARLEFDYSNFQANNVDIRVIKNGSVINTFSNVTDSSGSGSRNFVTQINQGDTLTYQIRRRSFSLPSTTVSNLYVYGSIIEDIFKIVNKP